MSSKREKAVQILSGAVVAAACAGISFAAADIATPIASPSPAPSQTPGSIPNDPYFSQQWSLRNDGTQTVMVDVDDFHTIEQTGTAGVDIGWLDAQTELAAQPQSPLIVAVIDSGIDPTQPDLSGRISPAGCNMLAVDITQFTAAQQTSGSWSCPSTAQAMSDTMGHGTQVAGIIAANTGNGLGIAGIAPQTTTILPLKILASSTTFTNFSYNNKLISNYAADAIRYAVGHQAQVINMSFGWPKLADTEYVRQAVQYAVQSGVLVVASAGNDKKDNPTYPCSYEGVLCVGSITNTGASSLYSDFGGNVDILAPGDDIVTTNPSKLQSQVLDINGYEIVTGTSESAPEVAGVAAALKSVSPSMTLDELRARLFASTAPIPAPSAALYGLVNLKRALDAQEQTLFLPDFKSIDSIVVSEPSLQVSGSVNLSALWQSAAGVEAQISINGSPAGSAEAATLATGSTLSVPWQYQFKSLDDSSSLNLVLQVSDAHGDARSFSLRIPAVRTATQISSPTVIPFPSSETAAGWIGNSMGHSYFNGAQVQSNPSSSGLPAVFQFLGMSPNGPVISIFDPSQPAGTPIQQIQIPNAALPYINQVVRIDVNGTGQMDWLITTQDQSGSPTSPPVSLFQFYFLNPQFQPLWGNATNSTWVVSPTGLSQAAMQDYSQPNSWINSGGGKLIPAFLAQGQLPAQDNFSELDIRSYVSRTHLVYLQPQPVPSVSPQPFTLLLPRAVDNSSFWSSNPNANLQNMIPAAPADAKAGHIRVLVSVGTSATDLDSQTMILDVPSISQSSLIPAPGWDVIGESGSPKIATQGATDYFVNFFDPSASPARGDLAWSSPQGVFLGDTEFSYSGTADPLADLVGAFDLGSAGHALFLTSTFNLIGISQPTFNSASQSWMVPLERDSSFPDQTFSQNLAPVLIGITQPLPGVYMDSTLIRGNQVAVAVMNPAQGIFDLPLRYSMQIPTNCAQLSPVQATSQPGSFGLPLVCPNGQGVQILLIQPAI